MKQELVGRNMNKIWHINIAALLIAVLPLPYVFYPALRLLVCGSSAYLIYLHRERWGSEISGWVLVFGGMAVLYNPIFPVFLPKAVWVVVNLISAAVFWKNLHTVSEFDET